MLQEIDIYRTAKLVIDQYGETALIEAALRQDSFLQRGDLDGAKTWSKIGDAIEWMQISSDITKDIMH